MMKLTLVLAAALVALPVATSAQQSPPPAPVRDTPFPDVPRDHWAFDAVEQMRKLGILRGYPPDPRQTTKPSPKPRTGSRTRKS